MTHQYMLTTPRSGTLKATSTWDRDTAPETTSKTRRFKEESRPGGQHSPGTATSSRVALDMLEETSLQPMHTSSNDIRRGNMGTTTQAKNKLAAAQTQMARNVLNITYWERKPNIWVKEKTQVTDVIEQVRIRKWIWAGHVSRIGDNRWTLHITNHLETLRKEQT